MIALWLAAAYLMGSLPTSYIVGRLARGIDLRQHGSGNLGATNAFRVLGWKAALPIFVIDIAKGWFPTAFFTHWDNAASPDWALAYGAAAIVGHVWSVYMRFRGGKGVATSAGVLVALAPTAALAGFVTWLVIVKVSGYVSLGSIVAALVVPAVVAVTAGVGPVLGLTCGLAIFVIWAHRANIRRLIEGRENRFGRKAGEAR